MSPEQNAQEKMRLHAKPAFQVFLLQKAAQSSSLFAIAGWAAQSSSLFAVAGRAAQSSSLFAVAGGAAQSSSLFAVAGGAAQSSSLFAVAGWAGGSIWRARKMRAEGRRHVTSRTVQTSRPQFSSQSAKSQEQGQLQISKSLFIENHMFRKARRPVPNERP